MLISVFRYIQGYLKVCVTGYSPERFLNLCKNKNIAIWGLEAGHNTYQMYMKISGFRKLKPILKKTKTKVVIEERVGLPFFFYRYRKRNLFFGGCFVCLFLIYSLTFFVWKIDLQGNQSLTDDVLMEYLETKDINHGMLKYKVNCENLVKDLRKDFDDIIWVSASIEGTNLTIHIKENTDTFQITEQETNACDIVATQPGIVKHIITRSGVPLVQVGDEVKQGDILISGSVEILNDAKEVVSEKLVVADGDIVLESHVEYKKEVAKNYKQKEYTGKKRNCWYLNIAGYNICIGIENHQYEKCEKSTTEHQLKITDNFTLPISVGKIIYKEYNFKNKEYSKEEMEKVLKDDFNQFCRNLEENYATILENHLIITEEKTKMCANSLIVIEQEGGIRRKCTLVNDVRPKSQK